MGIFYIDIEFTNGNFYLGEIFEIACLSENSGYIFHSFIKITTPIPRYIQKLCNTDTDVVHNSQPFSRVIKGLVEFIKLEDSTSTSPSTIIGHGSYLTDFPLLITNSFTSGFDYTQLEQFIYVDSMKILQTKGYSKPGLDTMSNTHRGIHSAVYDVKLLRNVVRNFIDYDDLSLHSFTLREIIQYIELKMPISIPDLYKLTLHTENILTFETILSKYMNEKTALKEKQIRKIANKFFSKKFSNVRTH